MVMLSDPCNLYKSIKVWFIEQLNFSVLQCFVKINEFGGSNLGNKNGYKLEKGESKKC